MPQHPATIFVINFSHMIGTFPTLLATAASTSLAVLIPRMLLSMVFVIACLWALARVLQKRGGGTFLGGTRKPTPIHMTSKMPLSRRAHVTVVEVGNRTLVLGVTDTAVNVLADISDDDPVAETAIETVDALPRTETVDITSSTWKDAIMAIREKTVRRT